MFDSFLDTSVIMILVYKCVCRTHNSLHNILRLFYELFFSPQVKRCASSISKHGIKQFSRHFRRWAGIRKLKNIQQNIRETQKLIPSRSALFHMETRVSLKYFVNDCSRTSEMEHFVKTVIGGKPLSVFAKSSILDVHLRAGYASDIIHA